MTLKIGKNDFVSNKIYHSDHEFISSTGIKLAYKDMREFYNQYVLGDMTNAPSGAQLEFGNLMHSLLLEPEKNLDEFAFFKGSRKYGKEWEAFKINNIDKLILTDVQLEKAKNIQSRFLQSKHLLDTPEGTKEIYYSEYFKGGEAEATFAEILEDVKVKVKTDYIKNNTIYDLKTTGEDVLTKENVEAVCARWGYDLSAALYVDVVSKIVGSPVDFYFIFTSTANSKVEIFKASENMLTRGRGMYKIGLSKIKEARETGIYFKNEIIELE